MRAGGTNGNVNLPMCKQNHGNGEGNAEKTQNHSHIIDCYKKLNTKLNELDVTSVTAKELAESLVFRE